MDVSRQIPVTVSVFPKFGFFGSFGTSLKTQVPLTSAEFELLALLVRHRGRVLTRDRIMDETRGIDWEAYDRSIDVLISRLRQKLGDDPKRPAFIRTVRGTGYSFIGGGPRE